MAEEPGVIINRLLVVPRDQAQIELMGMYLPTAAKLNRSAASRGLQDGLLDIGRQVYEKSRRADTGSLRLRYDVVFPCY